MRKVARGAAVGVLVSVLAAGPAAAQYGMDKKAPKTAATPELPRCDKPLGRVAIREPENDWWTGLGLSNPEAVIKLFAMRSGCLRVVDRNAGLAMRTVEAELGAGGDLRRGANVGKGQVAAADFFIVPDLANSNGNSSGGAIGTAVGAFGGRLGMAGALASGLTVKSQQAQALITLVDARTTEQLYVAEGVSKKTDIGFGGGGYYDGFAAIGGGYGNTAMGKVVTAAYFNAFVDLVGYLQRSAPSGADASQNAGVQAHKVKQAVVMRAGASPKAAEVRSFAVGDLVYPTGQKNGIWWEVDDENGNRGWVSSAMIGPA
ncbi:hypothetical protein LRS10_09285 [Phenylobacterium sp. J426]|uniref:CsgG/HfaB family protein n=1 Tax=Phenylobacterium sp. J426 TaxID=2898439 RepID=UPI002151C91B|nr:CsgG/HfaB family protein [Phenylobacterium sp. J426]MCR5874337.1 hypothetical protein [Phenylobacterium sp. J426]